MSHGRFATAINCMDGRTQEPVIAWAKDRFCVDYIDMITEPGVDALISRGSSERLNAVKERVMISVEKHGSRNICVVAHHDCAGNPVGKEEHLTQLKRCIDVVHSWGFPVKVFGLWVNDKWCVECVFEE